MDRISLPASILAVTGTAISLEVALAKSSRKVPKELLALLEELKDLQIVLESTEPLISSGKVIGPDPTRLGTLLSEVDSSLKSIEHQIHQAKVSHRGRVTRVDINSIRKNVAQPRAELDKSYFELLLLLSNSHIQKLSSQTKSSSQMMKCESSQLRATESVLRQIVKVQDTTTEHREQLLVSKQTLTKLQTITLSVIRMNIATAFHEGGYKNLYVPNFPCEIYHKSLFFASPQRLQGTFGRLTIRKTLQTTLYWKSNSNGICKQNSSKSIIRYVCPDWVVLLGLQLREFHGIEELGSFSFRVTPIIPKDSEVFRLCRNGDLAALKELLRRGEASLWALDSNSDTLLHVAVRDDQVEICEFLLSCGCDAGLPNNQNRSAADLAWDRILSDVADPAMMRLFLPYEGVLLNRRFSRLHLSVLGLFNDDLRQTLPTSTGLEINALDRDFRSPLYWAVRRADTLSIELLLQFGADPNVGASAIAWSCSNAFATSKCLRSLLNAGADPNGQDLDNHTALQACGSSGKGESFVSPLAHAGAHIDAAYKGGFYYHDGVTALGFASLNSHPQTVKVLLEHGADIHWRDARARTPLHLAVTQSQDHTAAVRRKDTLSLLLDRGCALDIRDAQGFTPANVAMFCQDVGSLATLMDFGSNIVYPPDLGPSHNGYCMLASPLENHWDLVSIFLLRRRDVNVLDRHPRTKETVLHLFARYGNRRLFVAFEEVVNLSQLDGQAINVSNRTALDFFNARSGNTGADIEAFNGLLRRIKGAQPDIPQVNRVPARENAFYDAEESNVKLDNQSVAVSKAQTQEDVEHAQRVEEWGRSFEVVNQSGNREYDLQYHPKTLGGPVYQDQDSEQHLTILAWQARHRRLRMRRKDYGFDSGYASAESNYSIEAEEEDDIEKEEGDAFMSTDASNVPGFTERKMKKDHKTSVLPQSDPPPNQWSFQSGLRYASWGAVVLRGIDKLVRLLVTIYYQKPLQESKAPDEDSGWEQWSLQPNGSYWIDNLTTRHSEISFLTDVILIAFFVSAFFSMLISAAPRVSRVPKLEWRSASFKNFCLRSLRPRVRENHQRITWTCVGITVPYDLATTDWIQECGKELYGDFATNHSSSLVELAGALSSTSSVNPRSCQTPNVPAQVHLGSQRNTQRQPDNDLIPAASKNAAHLGNKLAPFSGGLLPRFFELCVNTGEFSKTLGEIDVTRVKNDVAFFKLVRQRYREIRGHRIKKHYLLKPIGMRFVYFGLQNGHRISILKYNSFPSKEDVRRREYHYDPCPPNNDPPMPSDTFMHLMKCPREVSRYNWFHCLPKKLSTSITRSNETLPKAWGVHIFEGPDYVNILFTIICVLLVCTGLVVAYAVKTRDVSGAAGIGSFLATVVTLLWMAMKIEQWKDE